MGMTSDTMKISDELRTQIKDALAPLHPEKVILFRLKKEESFSQFAADVLPKIDIVTLKTLSAGTWN
jgi:hypothetical protein